ncbi:type IV-A pilus assembly ATPase PilB [Acidiferrobacter sp. SPIII_3]|uniref:type IV-A pilus assembly ATPase PilB n=1 Tax=Acidiferrobacter sp. SPIII_3 TaxID=1281578 RepID=UPI00197A9ACD|nr:type IV-A pilus assembly ATPase PilB [Acidiferrobacter sp. SPIII_3]
MANDGVLLTGLAARLVRDRLLTPAEAERLNAESLTNKVSFVTRLVESKKLDALTIAKVASEEFGIPLLDISAFDSETFPIKLVDAKLIRRHRVLPIFKRGNRLFVAVADPTNLTALDEIKFNTGLLPEPLLVEEGKLGQLIDRNLSDTGDSLADMAVSESLEGIDTTGDSAEPADAAAESDINDKPIVRFVNKILLDAINRGASDIHIEPYERTYRVRFRTDGVLQEVAAPPIALAARIAARVKILARLDISERRIPQDGRMKIRVSKTRAIDFRVSTLPTLFGEKVVMRLLDPASASLGVDKLGFESDQKAIYLEAIERPYGMVLVTGPTGSGKTVTLYTALNILNTPDRNISTAEDPVEINLAGINQVNINERAKLTFATALRAFLRQDPDIIMVGEIRDLETAEIAIKAAQTGHMVISTLHTNDAPQTLGRLVNMGVPPFNIASAVNLIIAQRLARRLCVHCRKPLELPEAVLRRAGFRAEDIPDLKIFGPGGCDQCNGGYKGRVGIYQVMPVSPAIGQIIMNGGNANDIAEQAQKDGVSDLRQSGLKKVREGITSLEEVERVTNE